MLQVLLDRVCGPRLSETARRVRADHLTYLTKQKLHNLETCARAVIANNVPGDFVETGVALGGSAIALASLMPSDRRFQGYDVFSMIPEPTSEHDDLLSRTRYEVIKSGQSQGLGGNEYYGYMDDLYTSVVQQFARYNVPVDGERIALHRGLFEDTLRFAADDRVALAHIDCDWYDPVRLCLQRMYPALSSGGFIVLDDYFDYAGCRAATDEFLRDHSDMRVVQAQGNMVLRRA